MESCFIYRGGNLHLFKTSRHRKIRDGFGKTSKIHFEFAVVYGFMWFCVSELIYILDSYKWKVSKFGKTDLYKQKWTHQLILSTRQYPVGLISQYMTLLKHLTWHS